MGKSDEFEDEVSRMRERRSRGRSRSQASKQKEAATGSTKETVTTKGKKKKPKSKKRLMFRIVIIILELLILLGIAGYVYVRSKFNQVQRVEDWKPEDIVNLELTPEQKEVMEGYKTIAVFGVDARDNKQLEKGTHSDVIMICNINMGTGEIQLVSVFRDTYLNINDKNTYRKINQAYFDGGPTQAVKALNKNLDLNIEDYVTFNWKAVIDGINILGGVDIEVNSKELRYLNAFITETVKATGVGSHQISKTGVTHMDGVQAVAYGRLRLMDSDYVRTERQKIVVKAAFEKAKKANLVKLNELAGVMLSETSTSLDWDDILPLIENVSKFYLGESLGFPMARGEMRLNGGDYVVPQTLESNVVELHKAMFENENYQPTSTLKKISEHIASVSGFKTPGKNAGSVVIHDGSSSSSTKAASTKATTKATESTKATEDNESRESSDESEDVSRESTEGRRPEQVTDENGRPIATEQQSPNSAGQSTMDSSEAGGISPANPNRQTSESHESGTNATNASEASGESGEQESSSAPNLTPSGNTGNGGSTVIITDKSPSEAGSSTASSEPTIIYSETTAAAPRETTTNAPGRPTTDEEDTVIVGQTSAETQGSSHTAPSPVNP
ncbi:MAG: LCP family protein [bacterium]|nr:LCP family protein [bacterium]